MTPKTSPLAVHIILDTNCLFTEAADKLIKAELSEFILGTAASGEINTTWHLPDIVRAERKHQMMVRARRLLPQLEKVESLIGHKFGITEEILDERVNAVIKREIERHGLQLHLFDASKVDWGDLISRSVERHPPFDPGENEKGFRDAVVLETFYQLIEGLPKSPQSCRIVLMSGDRLLANAARAKTEGRANVAVTGDLEEVRTLLNALASALTQETVAKLLPEASELFFIAGKDKTLYFAEKIYGRIANDYAEQLASCPDSEFTSSTVKRLVIGPPTFLAKSRQRLTFSSRLTFEVEATKVVWRSPPTINRNTGLTFSNITPGATGPSAPSGPGSTGLFGPSGVSGLYIPPLPSGFGTIPSYGATGPSGASASSPGASGNTFFFSPPGSPPPMIPEEIRRDGQHVFEVIWTATLTATGKLTRPKLERIEYKSTTWDEGP